MSEPRVLLVGFKFPHHRQGSGYDELRTALPHRYVDAGALPFGRSAFGSWKRRINLLLLDLKVLWLGLGYDVIHHLYGEHTATLSPLLHWLLGKRVVYTLHLKSDWWTHPTRNPVKWLKRRSLRRAAAVICLGRQHARDVAAAGIAATAPAVFVPHGFHLREFKGRRKIDEAPPSAVMIGENYRDLDLLERIVAGAPPALRFHFFGLSAANRERFARHAQVSAHAHVADDEFDAIVSRSDVMCLPLLFATANNALLECYLLGVVPVANPIPGVDDYFVDPHWFASSAEEFNARIDEVLALSVDDRVALHRRLFAAAQAEFDWPVIARKTEAVYRADLAAAASPGRSLP